MNLAEHDKVQLSKIKHNTKIKVLSPEHSEYIQKLSFEVGFKWPINGKQVKYTDAPYLCFDNDNTISWSNTFDVHGVYKEIFIPLSPKEPKNTLNIKPPFKFRNANLPIVRQWLKDNGFEFENPSLDIMEWNIKDEFGFVYPEGYFSTSNKPSYFSVHDYPEITFNLHIESVKYTEINDLQLELAEKLREVTELETKIKNLKGKYL